MRQRLGTFKDDGRKPKSNPAADHGDAVHSGISAVSDVLADPHYRALDTVVDRFMYFLRWAHERNPETFKRVLTMEGKRRRYFAESAEELHRTGQSVNPKQIPNSPFWVVTNNSTPRKQEILGEVLGRLGDDAATVAEAKRSLAEEPIVDIERLEIG